jgi:hypothetical protein
MATVGFVFCIACKSEDDKKTPAMSRSARRLNDMCMSLYMNMYGALGAAMVMVRSDKPLMMQAGQPDHGQVPVPRPIVTSEYGCSSEQEAHRCGHERHPGRQCGRGREVAVVPQEEELKQSPLPWPRLVTGSCSGFEPLGTWGSRKRR